MQLSYTVQSKVIATVKDERHVVHTLYLADFSCSGTNDPCDDVGNVVVIDGLDGL